MAEDIIPPVDVGTPPPAETPPPEPSALPSDTPPSTDFSGFELDDATKALFKDGKLNGRFGSITDVLAKLKEAEDYKSATISEQKKLETQHTDDVTLKTTQDATINAMIPAFMENGMVLTPEMEAQATEAKIDIRDLKLGAMELREAVGKAHSVVGGKEEYDNMLAWGKENMSDTQKRAFDSEVTSTMSEYAIKGLYGDYKKAIDSGTHTPRIAGSPANVGLKPYASRKELYKDKDFAEASKRKGDMKPWNDYQAKLRITSREVTGI